MGEKILWNYVLCCLNNENYCSNIDTKQVPKAMFGNCFRFLFSFSCFQGKKKKKINFCQFSKWKTRLVSWKEKHIFQKQNLGNLFDSCFWLLFFLKIIFILIQKHICSKVFKILTPRGIIKSNVFYITFKPETLII